MTFDRFIEILKQNGELDDWYVDQYKFKGDQLSSAIVVFEFEVKDLDEGEVNG